MFCGDRPFCAFNFFLLKMKKHVVNSFREWANGLYEVGLIAIQ